MGLWNVRGIGKSIALGAPGAKLWLAQLPLKPGAVVPTELLHLHPSVGTANDGGQGQEENGCERVSADMGVARIRHAVQTAPQGRGQARGHEENPRVSTGNPNPGQTAPLRNLAIVLSI